MPIKIKMVANPYVHKFEENVNQLLQRGWTPQYGSLSTNRGGFYMILTREVEPPLVSLKDLHNRKE